MTVSHLDPSGSTSAGPELLGEAYEATSAAVSSLPVAGFMQPSRCAGWTVQDLLFHQLSDAHRALVTYATPAPEGAEADVDGVTYWSEFSAGADSGPGSEGAALGARFVRIGASAYQPEWLVESWTEASSAASRLAAWCPFPLVTTQGHVLRTNDFTSTLVVEAIVHFLDLGLEAVAPPASGLELVVNVLDGLAGVSLRSLMQETDPTTLIFKATGRMPLQSADVAALGPEVATRFPLFG